jgi:hypothetical protein
VKHHLDELGVKNDGQRLPALIDAVKARSRTLLDIAKQVAVRLDATKGGPTSQGHQLSVSKMGDAFSVICRPPCPPSVALSGGGWRPATLRPPSRVFAGC